MRRPLLSLLAAGLAALAVPAARADDAEAGRLVSETWEAAYLGGVKAGHARFSIRHLERGGKKVVRATRELTLTVKRFQDTSRLEVETGDEETPEGKVTGVFMKQKLGKGQFLQVTGTVSGANLDVVIEGMQQGQSRTRWDDTVLGAVAEQNVLRDRKLKPGDSFEYRMYEPTVTNYVTVRGTVGKLEAVEVEGQGKRELLRVEAKPDRLMGIQLPGTTGWYDPKTLEAVRSQSDLPGLGTLVLVRTTKQAALAPPGAPKVNIGLDQAIRLNDRPPNIHTRNKIVYRITLENDEAPATAFATDDVRQRVTGQEGRTIELTISPVRAPRVLPGPAKPAGAEFLKSNYFITSDDPRVKKLAAEAVGDETDPWREAKLVERWVHQNMKVLNFTEAMAPASTVATSLEGDCTEFAMLTAAMCRAVGVPSRTALGLVYYEDRNRTPMLAYHMWTEVYVSGQWLGLDATLGQGSVGVGHLKITDHSWHNVQSLTPLLPVMRVMMGKPKVEWVK
jgi:hypothetical protein